MLAAAPVQHDHEVQCAVVAQGEVTLATWLDAMTDRGWSACAAESTLGEVLRIADQLHPADRMSWLNGLRQMWRRQGWALSHARLAELVELTSVWGDWPLLIEVGLALERRRALSSREAWHVVVAHRQMGERTVAVARCRSRMFAHPKESWPLSEYCVLQQIGDVHNSVAPITADDGLRLEPLGHHHLQDFAAQYYDPDIAELCCLPKFTQDAQWYQWLDTCWGYGDQGLYAVIDPRWGFVGSVSLILHDGIGFFYYWIGRDFRGCGLGTAAVRLLLDHAAQCLGMRACYAKVFDYNAPSRRALEKLGFVALDFRPTPPYDDELLYRCGPEQSRQQSAEELRTLLERMQSEMRVAVPIQDLEVARRAR